MTLLLPCNRVCFNNSKFLTQQSKGQLVRLCWLVLPICFSEVKYYFDWKTLLLSNNT